MTTTATQPWTSSITEVSGSNVEVVTGGSGNPLVILHDELGHPGWLRYHEALAQQPHPAHPVASRLRPVGPVGLVDEDARHGHLVSGHF